MLPDTSRLPRVTMVLAVLTGLAIAVPTWLSGPATPGQASAAPPRTVGPATEADRTLLVTLRQFVLFAVPVGQQARQMAADPEVRTMAGSLATDLDTLSDQVRTAADRLGVVLPSQPTGQQRAWSAGISSSAGAGYDQAAVNRLRAGCATARAAIDNVMARPGDDRVHRLAEQAAGMLDRHLWSLDRFRPVG